MSANEQLIQVSDQAGRPVATFIVTGAALFMMSLDNLVVTNALPRIRVDLHASLQGLEWTVNAYTLTFSVLLLSGAALGDRYGRRRLLLAGLALFTAASAAAALAPSTGVLIAARAVQGVGGAAVVPLTLTLLVRAVPAQRRELALTGWSAMAGLAIALGPVIGGAIVTAESWQWIFWVNVPIGLALVPLGRAVLMESYGDQERLDVVGTGLATIALFGIVLGLIRADSVGWASPEVLGSLIGGVLVLAVFAAWETRATMPMLPPRLLRVPGFALANMMALLATTGMFGAVFLLAQFLQTVQGYSPLAAGLRTLPWTAAPMIVAPSPASSSLGSACAADLIWRGAPSRVACLDGGPGHTYDAVPGHGASPHPGRNRDGSLLRAARASSAQFRGRGRRGRGIRDQ